VQEHGGLPRFVIKQFEEYLRCGRLDHGCLHLVCRECGHSELVAFSCKRRGFCPSCLGRRMADTAVHLALCGGRDCVHGGSEPLIALPREARARLGERGASTHRRCGRGAALGLAARSRFAADLDTCPRCSGPMRWAEVATRRTRIAHLLAEHGLGPRAPPAARRLLSVPEQLEMGFGKA
jgi:hypothetical protein